MALISPGPVRAVTVITDVIGVPELVMNDFSPSMTHAPAASSSVALVRVAPASLRDRGKPFKQAAALAKLYATEAAVTATREATQIFGGYGFMDETLVSRHYRDSKILEIGEGTSEVQRMIIARGLGLPL